MKHLIFTAVVITMLSGCGLKGNLYIPKNTQVQAPAAQTVTPNNETK